MLGRWRWFSTLGKGEKGEVENDVLISLFWVVYNTIARWFFNSVLKINPDISEVTVSSAIKHHEESKYKHLYSHLTFILLFFPPEVSDFGDKALPRHAEQAKPKHIYFSSMS